MLTVLLALLPLQDSSSALAVDPGFHYEPGRLAVGRVYHYEKSNVDGSRKSHVDLYVASETRIESFKWHEGGSEATLVVADMNWKTMSVARFETTKLFSGGTSTLVAELKESADGKELVGKVGGGSFRAKIEQRPWHTYDFDLASLNVALRFLEDPEATVTMGMMDIVRTATRQVFRHKGGVELWYEGDEERGGVACRRYGIDGPGLEDRGGNVWVRKTDDPVIVDYEIDLPDEPGMTSGKMWLLGETQLTPDAWTAHQRSKLN